MEEDGFEMVIHFRYCAEELRTMATLMADLKTLSGISENYAITADAMELISEAKVSLKMLAI